MAKQIINLGTSPNKGDGDPLRTAFDKVNDNFNELYTALGNPSGATNNVLPNLDATIDLGSADKQWSDLYVKDFIYLNGAKIEVTAGGALLVNGGAPAEVQDTVGSVFGDDSTLLVDGVNNIIPSANISGTEAANWDTAFLWGDHSAAGYAPQATTYTKVEVDAAIAAVDPFSGDVTGSVFADDSTLLVDGVNGVIPKANIEDSTNWDAAFGWGDHAAAGYADGTNEANWDTAFAWGDHSTVGYQSATAPFTGDVKGSVFADDSTLLVDGTNGIIPTSVLQGDITNPIRTGDIVIESTQSPGSITITHAGIGGITLDASTSTDGILLEGDVSVAGSFTPPMLTQAEIDALTPTLGMMVYNTTTGKFQGYAADANNDSTTGWADLH